MTNDIRRLESDLQSLRQRREEGNKVAGGIKQELERFRQQLQTSEMEVQEGRAWREEMTDKLCKEREEREADRAYISAILNKY